jgi:hypothetical protein
MNLSSGDKSADGMFSDNYDDNSFFKDGNGDDLLSNKNPTAKKPSPQPASPPKMGLDESYNNSINDDYSDNFTQPK